MAMTRQAIYRDYDRAELDRQLNLRARWPEHAEYFARWARESAVLRGRLGGWIDVAYGRRPGERLDLFAPAEGAGRPLLAFIHGGYWQSLDKGDFTYLAPAFLDSGIWYAALNYDLAPSATLPEMVAQIRRALGWLYRAAEGYGFDRERIFVAGHSAGGHLAVMALITDWAAEAPGEGGPLPAELVKGACSVSGVYDLEPVRLSYHNAVLGLDEAAVAVCSPARRLPDRAGPLICAVGDQETEEFLRQQAELVAAWRGRGLPAGEVGLLGRQHFSAIDALGEADHPLFAAVRELVLTEAPPVWGSA